MYVNVCERVQSYLHLLDRALYCFVTLITGCSFRVRPPYRSLAFLSSNFSFSFFSFSPSTVLLCLFPPPPPSPSPPPPSLSVCLSVSVIARRGTTTIGT